jgi:hypothetical protein
MPDRGAVSGVEGHAADGGRCDPASLERMFAYQQSPSVQQRRTQGAEAVMIVGKLFEVCCKQAEFLPTSRRK